MKRIILLLFFILLIPSINAIQTLGTFQKDVSINLVQTCDNCTQVNVTKVQLPNSSIVKINKEMTKDGTEYNYTFTQTDLLGDYIYTSCGDDDGVNTCASVSFDITPTGLKASTGDSILYSLFSIILFGFILTLSFLIFAIPNSNERDEGGFETKIVKMKYIRMVFMILIYPLTILLLNFLTGLASNFSSLSMFKGILGFLFETLMRLSWSFTFIMITWIVIMLIHDTNVSKQLKKLENMRIY